MKSWVSQLLSPHVGVALLTCFWGAAQAADPGVGESELTIGQTITLQSGKNDYGVAAQAGMKLYFDSVNAAGGVHGRKIVVRTLDDDNKNATAEANARKLVQDGVFILFGRWPARRRCGARRSRWCSRCGPSTATSSAPS
jgi:Periplasmic binding protein